MVEWINILFDNLNWCYDILFENKDGLNIIIINVCVNHYTKIIGNHLYFKPCGETVQSV